MFKNKFFKTTFILMVGGVFTKLLGFIIRIVYTRIVGEEGIALYMLVIPSYSLMVSIATLGLPIAISKVVAEGKKRSLNVLLSMVPVIIGINLIIILIIVFSSSYISEVLLHEEKTKTLLISMSLVLPFISLSSLIRGYFFGKQQMMPHTISNIVEQAFKLGIVLLILPKLLKYGTLITVNGLILISILSETISIIIFIIYFPKRVKITKNDVKPDLYTIKEIFKISIPTVSSRFIGNVGYFFEPIILTNILLSVGYSKHFIISEYGIYNAYVITLLMIPSFFISAISQSLIPEISKLYYQGNFRMVKKRIKEGLIFSLLIGIAINTLIFLFANPILEAVYNTTKGIKYLKALIPFFTIFYLEGPLISSLQAIDKAGTTFKITLIGTIIKSLSLIVFSYLKIGLYSLIISEIINIFIVVGFNYAFLKKELSKISISNYIKS